jgi:hypothetical protein
MRNDRQPWLSLAMIALVLAAVAHSIWATSLDSFTIDEPYHIAAGATYLRWGDYRVNPEHPPLVKMFVALAEPASVLHLDPLRIMDDKGQEREYTQTAVFLKSNGDQVRRRSRFAMMVFNGALLLMLGWVVRRIFGWTIALATLLLLALDPTVSAHLPVVMTDLPMALLGTICCCMAILCLRNGLWRNWILFGVVTGLLLATKHSAPLIATPVLIGCVCVFAWRRAKGEKVGGLAARLAVAVLLSFVVLWGTYGFHYRESRLKDAQGHSVETFNRPLDAKIGDLRSPALRKVLTVGTKAHLLPRAYIWGLADTLRAGVEGRPFWVNVFGHSYRGKAPWWVLLAFLVVKLPIGFMLLALAGVGLLLAKRLDKETATPLSALCLIGFVFMAFLAINGIFYAGLRHFLFIIPLLAIVAAVGVAFCLERREAWVRALPVVAVMWIAVTVLPQRRIWEYHNAFAGGSENAWRKFDNESVDLGQRTGELIAFDKAHIAPDELLVGYWALREQMKAAGVKQWEPSPAEVATGHLTGWFCLRAPSTAEQNWEEVESLRVVTPTAKLGNLLLYHGTFYLPRMAAGILSFDSFLMLEQQGADKKLIEKYLMQAIALDPKSMRVAFELGNFAVIRKDRDKALQWYELAQKNAADSPALVADIGRQIELVKTKPLAEIVPMRNPANE